MGAVTLGRELAPHDAPRKTVVYCVACWRTLAVRPLLSLLLVCLGCLGARCVSQLSTGLVINGCTLVSLPATDAPPTSVLLCRYFINKGGLYGLKRFKERAERRMTGAPQEGQVAIVLTDIENYSGA